MRKLRIVNNALKSIARNPTRTFLTTLGIVIGIASVICLMEIGDGANIALKQNITEMGADILNIRPGTMSFGGVNIGSGSNVNLTEKDLNAIRKHSKLIKYASPMVNVRGQVIYGNKNWSPFYINGVNQDYRKIANWKMEDGIFFTRNMVLQGEKVCVVGKTIVRELFGNKNPVGEEIQIQNVKFKVIGVFKAKGNNMMGFDQDDVVCIPWTTVRSRLRGAGASSISSSSTVTISTATSTSAIYPSKVSFYPPASSDLPPVKFGNIDQIILCTGDFTKVTQAADELIEIMRESHKLQPDQDNDFYIRNMAEFTELLTNQTKTMARLLLCVALISLIVGGVGIMNIMLVSVTERTKEIGLRMAVGARASDILRQFLIESIVICLVGGIIGMALGHGLSLTLSNLLGWPIAISYTAIFVSVCVSATVGIIFGYYPAWKASKLDPIEALRYE